MIYDPNSTEVNSDADVLEHPANDTLEQMPLSLLPEPFRQMSEAISHSARVPQSLAGCCVLGGLSASIGSGLKVRAGPIDSPLRTSSLWPVQPADRVNPKVFDWH